MNRARPRPICLALALMLAAGLSACQAVDNTTQAAASSTKQWADNTRRSFAGFFVLSPKPNPQLPQTRYCYQMQTDIVCYDVPQPNMTARLSGYQNGDQISFIRNGGGSLGFSAPPMADLQTLDAASGVTSQSNMPEAENSGNTQCMDANGRPFYCGESPFVTPAAPTQL
jgi:hypothetical protein